jgi:serine protease AprX
MKHRHRFPLCMAAILVFSLIAPALSRAAPGSFAPAAYSLSAQMTEEFTLDLGGMRFDPAVGALLFPGGWRPYGFDGSDLRLVQLAGPVQDAWLAELSLSGLEIVQYIHPYTYVVWGTQAQADAAVLHSFVRWTGNFAPAYKVLPPWRGLGDAPVDVILMIYKGADHLSIQREIQLALGGRMTGLSSSDPAFYLAGFTLPGSRFMEAAQLPGVYSIQPVPTDGGDRGEMSGQINAGNYNAGNAAFPGYMSWLTAMGVNGNGVVIANVDSGVAETHPDLAGQFLPCTGSTCGGAASSSHGSHTAGIMAGTGASGVLDSFGFLRALGVAPGARMVEQLYSPTYTQPGGMLTLMTQSYRNGALLSGNSWGPAGFPLGYDNNTRQVDVGVRDADPDLAGNQEFSYILSIMNGNGGTSSQGTPDEAKNIFTIGSTKMQNSGTGSQILQINDISANSAHGPSLDGRKIPHMVAPGCYVDSSSTGTSYALLCGTSMASPQISGAAALFIEYYRNLFGVEPSPAMIKAAFLPVAHDLAGSKDANNGTLGHPFDSKQGWGRMNLPPVLSPELPVRYFDNPVIFDNTGETWTQVFSPLDPSQPVRLMLVWTDAPGHGLGGSTPAWNNDLDLSVFFNGETYKGNVFGADGWSVPGGAADYRNNTEGIFLGPTVSEQVQVTVTAANITSDGVPFYGDGTDQDFALVCYNCALEPDFTLAITPGLAAICGIGQSAFDVTVGSIMDYDEPVTLSVRDLPPSTIDGFSTNPVFPPGQSALTLANSGAAPGSYTLILDGVSIDKVHSLDFTWKIDTASPGTPLPQTPANNAVNQPPKPTFTWNPAAQGSTYRLQAAIDPAFTNLVVDVEGLSDTSFVPASDLNTGTQYFWRVRASNACGTGSYSPTFRFTTLAAPGDCGPGSTPIILHQTGFEDGPDGWAAVGGTQNEWALSTSDKYSGIYSFFGTNPSSVTDQRLHSPSIALPPDQSPLSLSFWNRYAFDNDFTCYDGGILEVTTNGGTTWSQVPNSAMLTMPYNGTVGSGWSNPLGGMPAWCFSKPWTRAVVDLNAYAGQTVQLRYRIGTDSVMSATGWYVDDVKVQSCQAAPAYGAFLSPSEAAAFGDPGDSLSYALTLANTGSQADTFTFTAEGGWAANLPTPVFLAAGEAEDVTVTVHIPADGAPGSVDALTVTATSTGDPFATAQSVLTTVVIDYAFVLEHGDLEQAGFPGDELTFSFTLNNTGNMGSLFELSLESGWLPTMPGSISVMPGASSSFDVVLPIPADAPLGATVTHMFKAAHTINPGQWQMMPLAVEVLIPNRAPVLEMPIPAQAATVGRAFSFTVPAATFSDPDGDELALSASLQGGAALPAWLSFEGGAFSGQPSAVETLTLEVTASDGEYAVTASFELKVELNIGPLAAGPIANRTARPGQAFVFVLPENTFSDPDGDDLALSAVLEGGAALPAWLSFDPQTWTFSGTPPGVGSYVIKVTASDGMEEVSSAFVLEVEYFAVYLPVVRR